MQANFANEAHESLKDDCEIVEASHIKVGDILPFGKNCYKVTDIMLQKEEEARYHYDLRLVGARDASGDTYSKAAFGNKLWRMKRKLDLHRGKR